MIKILIIEDDPMVAKFNKLYIEKVSGFEVIATAYTIKEANLLLSEKRPNLILLDIYVGNKNGLDFLIDLRSKGNAIDVIVITAANDYFTIQKSLYYGAVDYLIKPFDFKRFEKSLLKYMNKYNAINNKNDIEQSVLDSYLLDNYSNTHSLPTLPKGVSSSTLKIIVKIVLGYDNKVFSTKDITQLSGISHVSVSKYLKFLVNNSLLLMEFNYNTLGRPSKTYKINVDKKEILESYFNNLT